MGLASLLDPPRETVPAALAKCKRAGMNKMNNNHLNNFVLMCW